MKIAGHLVNYPAGLSGEKGVYYDYIMAGNGLFIEAANARIAARIPVAECPVRGLAPIKPQAILTYGSIPQHFFDLALDTFLADPDREHYVGVTASAGYDFYVPAAEGGGEAKVVYATGDNVVMDIHSHAHMPAFFSTRDDEDETGLKISVVVGRLNATPVVKLRVGVYGYYMSLAWHDVFDGSLCGAIESEEEEVPAENDVHSLVGTGQTQLQHNGRWVWWNRWLRR